MVQGLGLSCGLCGRSSGTGRLPDFGLAMCDGSVVLWSLSLPLSSCMLASVTSAKLRAACALAASTTLAIQVGNVVACFTLCCAYDSRTQRAPAAVAIVRDKVLGTNKPKTRCGILWVAFVSL